MSAHDPKQVIRIDLTPNQRDQVRSATGRESEALELTIQELEERIAPRIMNNRNETFLRDTAE
jgi:hypothetical protein